MKKILFSAVQAQADRLLSSPQTLRFLSDPRVQKAMMQLINLRGDLHQKVSGKVQGFARNYSLVTRDDMAKLRRTVRELQNTISTLESEVTSLRATEEATGSNAEQRSSETPSKPARTPPRPKKQTKVAPKKG